MDGSESGSREAALDHVAFLLSESVISLMEAVGEISTEPDRPAPRSRKSLGLIAWIAATIRGSLSFGRSFVETQGPYLDATRLYGEVTAFDQGQARADMLFAQKRLLQLTSEPFDKALVYQVARRLVHWTAEGRPADAGLEKTEAHFERSLKFQSAGARAWKSSQCGLLEEAYRQAWRDDLGTES